MPILKVEAIPVSYEEPNDYNSERHLCLVRIEDSSGHVGWGEAVTMWKEATIATANVIKGMEELLLNRDAESNGVIIDDLIDHIWWYGYKGGIAGFAISAIDIALWDLKGKNLDKNVLDLIGGKVQDKLPVIASGHAHQESIDDLAEEAATWVTNGIHGMKIGFGKKGDSHLGFDHDRDVEYVKKVRKSIGSEKLFMIDLGWIIKWDIDTAIQRAKSFEEYEIDWLEEPLGDWNPDGYKKLKNSTDIRMAYGEKEWDMRGYNQILETETVDVVGFDPGRSQGITGFVKLLKKIEELNLQANAHAWSSSIVTAASLAVSFSSKACKLFEFKPLPNPMQNELISEPIVHSEGWVYPMTNPGLGIDVNEDFVKSIKY
ncbi:MAG: mandelate racemase/muconate lactonizing enzyme family protein [Candidatus Actinomarinales bacterium]|nr:MAG: mandelate racemase/muconate lactonizing enzyme family protein [Candidatus Actinomarinales bacterium]